MRLCIVLFLVLITQLAYARQVKVSGYTKRSGKTYRSYRRTSPNRSRADNWNAKGNVNPTNGKPGTKALDTPVMRYGGCSWDLYLGRR